MNEHDPSGAFGVILNAPSTLSVEEVLPELAEYATAPAVVHLGGPVQTDAAMVMTRSSSGPFARATSFTDIGYVDPASPPRDATSLRVYAGFAGWSPGQLEEEVENGSWWATPATAKDIFATDTSSLWAASVSRVAGRVPLYATYPADPSMN